MENDGQGVPISAPHGEEPAHESGSQGGTPPASGEQAPQTPASQPGSPSIDDLLEQTHLKSLVKGAKKAKRDLEDQWGLSIEEVSKLVEDHNKTKAPNGGDGDIDYRKAFSELRKAHSELEKKNAALSASMEKLSSRAQHAKHSKIKALYLQAGAVPGFCDDLVALTADYFEWSEEGDLEVVERKNGQVIPSRLSVDAFIKKQGKDRGNFFLSQTKAGSGSETNQSSTSASKPAVGSRRKAFDPRKKLAESRGR